MTIAKNNSSEKIRFFKFAIVGLIGAILDFGIMNLLVASIQSPFVIAGTISFICAVISNFSWNRIWTYPESRSKPIVNQLGQFSLVNAAGLLIRLPILKFGEPAMDKFLSTIPSLTKFHQFISHNATLAIAVGIVMMWNFFVNRYWTYNDIDPG
jgi:putative flippase GtrA